MDDMTDTSVADAPTVPDENGKPRAKRGQVEYTLEVVDALPERGVGGSPFDDMLDKIIAIHDNAETRGQLFEKDGTTPKWVLIGRYEHSTAAGAAANVLGHRHGKNPTVEGWDFAARRIDDGDKTGLFVRYDPTRIVPGAKEAWEKSEVDRKVKLAKAREAKKAGETPQPQPQPVPQPPAPTA